MAALLYDTGALVAADRGDWAMLTRHQAALRIGTDIIVPVVVLAQAWRGGPQHGLSRLLKGCTILPDDASSGKAAGQACAAARTSDVVDALVVVTALRLHCAVVTSDPDDLTHLADSIGIQRLPLIRV